MLAIKAFTANNTPRETFEVIHPIYDVHEEKLTGAELGKIKLTPTVKLSLLALRLYIITMGSLLIYHVLDLVGLFGHHVAR